IKTSSGDSENSFSHESLEPQLFTQQKLDDLVRELQLTKAKAELLASCLRNKEYNLLDKSCKITKYWVSHKDFCASAKWMKIFIFVMMLMVSLSTLKFLMN
ncbi:MAG: hypothetical protein ACTS77_03690, partial [Arsenophonus sp. NC-TX2-MAG3]